MSDPIKPVFHDNQARIDEIKTDLELIKKLLVRKERQRYLSLLPVVIIFILVIVFATKSERLFFKFSQYAAPVIGLLLGLYMNWNTKAKQKNFDTIRQHIEEELVFIKNLPEDRQKEEIEKLETDISKFLEL